MSATITHMCTYTYAAHAHTYTGALLEGGGGLKVNSLLIRGEGACRECGGGVEGKQTLIEYLTCKCRRIFEYVT